MFVYKCFLNESYPNSLKHTTQFLFRKYSHSTSPQYIKVDADFTCTEQCASSFLESLRSSVFFFNKEKTVSCSKQTNKNNNYGLSMNP